MLSFGQMKVLLNHFIKTEYCPVWLDLASV